MSTRSMIGRYNEDGTITAIYCHYDGYVDGVGLILDVHYYDDDKVQDLIGLGDLSSLGGQLGEKHEFSDSANHQDWCTAYHRDRGEKMSCHRYEDTQDYMDRAFAENGADYIYLWDGEAWFVAANSGKNAHVWDDVREALKDLKCA